jgi:hypothetical protein
MNAEETKYYFKIILKNVTVKIGNDNGRSLFFSRELKGDQILVMLAIIQSKTFCLLICCRKKEELEYTISLRFFMSVKLGL